MVVTPGMERAVRVLGVDGGGTKTLAVVADRAGRVVGFAVGADTNPLDQPSWRQHLAETVAAALGGLSPADLVGAAFGLPVHGEVPEISAEQLAWAHRLWPGASVRNDVQTAHDGAFAGGAGVLLLSGTGSMCWAVDAAGRICRVGGWGDGFGDEGSAHWIGRAALSLASQILDGRATGEAFARSLLASMGVAGTDPHEAMLRWFYTSPNRRPAVAALAATVDALAAGGDEVAGWLLDEAADALALHVTTARRRLGLAPCGPWCFVGGVSRSAPMHARLASRLGPPAAPILPPIGGAVWRAADNAGWAPDAAWIDRLRTELAQRLEPS